MPSYNHISVAVPVLAEKENLPQLLTRLRQQTISQYTLYVYVNNEEGGYGYDDNQQCLQMLRQVGDMPLVVIDRSSHGLGWSGKRQGVGWARKLLFERIMETALSEEENKIGLQNVIQRLHLIYGGRARFTCEESAGMIHMRLTLPEE